jgi:hypothetical protein
VGIWSGGAWLAERLQADLGRPGGRRHQQHAAPRRFSAARPGQRCRRHQLPSRSNGRHILLSTTCCTPAAPSAPCSTSCSTSAARPACTLAVLVDRGGRELPIAGRLRGAAHRAAGHQRCRWRATDDGRFSFSVKGPQLPVMLSRRNPQLNKHGELIHLLSIEGLPQGVLTHILDTASTFLSVNDREVKKVPLLRGKSVFNLFFENSTRTRTTFEIAAKRLSADVINLDIAAQRQQGREPARHHRQPVGDARRHVRGAPQRERRALPDRPALRAACARGQRR